MLFKFALVSCSVAVQASLLRGSEEANSSWLESSAAKSRRRRRGSGLPKLVRRPRRREVNMESLLAEPPFWEGYDVPDRKIRMSESQFEVKPEDVRTVQLWGLQHSGLSILKAMLYANFGDRLHYLGSTGATKDEVQSSVDGFWSHSSWKDLHKSDTKAVKKLMDEHVWSIMIVRNPYSWLTEMRQQPIDKTLEQCVKQEAWLSSPCKHPFPGGPLKDGIDEHVFDNIPDLWNQYMDAYLNPSKYGFKKTLMVFYENLVQHPDSEMAKISKALKLGPVECGVGTQFHKQLTASLVREQVARDLDDRKHMRRFTNQEKGVACRNLDSKIMDALNYQQFQCDNIVDATPGKEGPIGLDG